MDAAIGVSGWESVRKGCQWVRVKLGKLARPTAEAGSSPTACLGSPELRREEEEGSDGRDPPVSDRARRGIARAAHAWAERERAGLRAEFLGRSWHNVFFFFLLCKICFMFDFV